MRHYATQDYEYTDKEIAAFVAGRYSKTMAKTVWSVLHDEDTPVFADHVRRSFVREMREQEQQPE